MRLFSEVLARAGVTPERLSGDAPVSGISDDSRKAKPADVFVCMPFESGDSHRFIPAAREKGAVAALVHTEEGSQNALDHGLAAALIPNQGHSFAEALWRVCREIFDDPSAKMRALGITGTNGKTTTACVIRDALNSLDRRAAYLGTLGFQTPDTARELSNTTPFAVETWSLLAEAANSGCTDFVMEVSSHALDQRRTDGIQFDAAVFTNLTQDHLDFHGSMEAYEAAKLRLFTDYPAMTSKRFVGALNVDDPVGAKWSRRLSVPMLTFGTEGGELRGEAKRVTVSQIELLLSHRDATSLLESHLGGNFNVKNLLSACAGLMALGYSLEEAIHGLEAAKPVPGRFEAVPNDQGIGILVDYAHTPDALEKLLLSVRELEPNRLIAVFGCGGDRDKSKRPKMAAVTSRLADLTVVTSDNPRTEDPAQILRDVVAGLQPASESVQIMDRREAVAYAIKVARPGDVVVIAGKGHENYQIIGKTKYPMDDRDLAKEGLAALGSTA